MSSILTMPMQKTQPMKASSSSLLVSRHAPRFPTSAAAAAVDSAGSAFSLPSLLAP